MKKIEPIVEKVEDNIGKLEEFRDIVSKLKDKKKKDIIMNFPTVYIHNWKNKDQYEVYVGESNDVFERTKQHYKKITSEKEWQHNLLDNKAELYIIAHNYFNKSMTMDIESKLIHYLTGVENIKKVHNGRDNPQKHYYPYEKLEEIFAEIWEKLKHQNEKLFPPIDTIKNSAIFKASPLHKLTEKQQDAKEKILEKIDDALRSKKRGQLIFVEGEAGTGKTVLNSSTFYELFCKYEKAKENKEDLKYKTTDCYLLVNHDEQITVYQQIFDKLGIIENYGQVIEKPTTFINNHSIKKPVDVVFVDEGHLLLTQGKMAYRGKNQLKDILERAKVVVVMFDENQILTTEQYWEYEELQEYRKDAEKNGNYIKLEDQLRMNANKNVIEWIDSLTKDGILKDLPSDLGDYDIKVFTKPEYLNKAIEEKASKDDSKLSRIIATYDWKYKKDNHKDCPDRYWNVKIKEWMKPWNRELEKDLDKKYKRNIKNLAWAEQPHTINEVGSTYTIQGFDLDYAGVILGPSVRYEDGHIVLKPNYSFNEKAKRNRTLSDGTKQKFGEELLKHEVRVLMTRGVKGLYIYARNDKLRKKLLECQRKYKKDK